MKVEELQKKIRCGETSRVQFKQQFTSQKQIAEEMVAFANSEGGDILFGIEDKTGRIVGLDYVEIQNIKTYSEWYEGKRVKVIEDVTIKKTIDNMIREKKEEFDYLCHLFQNRLNVKKIILFIFNLYPSFRIFVLFRKRRNNH